MPADSYDPTDFTASDIHDLVLGLEELESENQSLKEQALDLFQMVEILEGDNTGFQERLDEAEKEEKKLREQLEDTRADLKDHMKIIERMQEEHDSLKDDLEVEREENDRYKEILAESSLAVTSSPGVISVTPVKEKTKTEQEIEDLLSATEHKLAKSEIKVNILAEELNLEGEKYFNEKKKREEEESRANNLELTLREKEGEFTKLKKELSKMKTKHVVELAAMEAKIPDHTMIPQAIENFGSSSNENSRRESKTGSRTSSRTSSRASSRNRDENNADNILVEALDGSEDMHFQNIDSCEEKNDGDQPKATSTKRRSSKKALPPPLTHPNSEPYARRRSREPSPIAVVENSSEKSNNPPSPPSPPQTTYDNHIQNLEDFWLSGRKKGAKVGLL